MPLKFHRSSYRYPWFAELNISYFDIAIPSFNAKCMFTCKSIVVTWNTKECNVLHVLTNVCLTFTEIAADWSDHALWWPDKNQWLLRSRSTLDQYEVHADAKLLFTPMHKTVRLQLPDLQILEMRMNFSSKVFAAITSLCKELGTIKQEFWPYIV